MATNKKSWPIPTAAIVAPPRGNQHLTAVGVRPVSVMTAAEGIGRSKVVIACPYGWVFCVFRLDTLPHNIYYVNSALVVRGDGEAFQLTVKDEPLYISRTYPSLPALILENCQQGCHDSDKDTNDAIRRSEKGEGSPICSDSYRACCFG
tara:strand:+ start:130 stop:576 length:447 start_codon:yes stop_codon:yes gene_type:complete